MRAGRLHALFLHAFDPVLELLDQQGQLAVLDIDPSLFKDRVLLETGVVVFTLVELALQIFFGLEGVPEGDLCLLQCML